MKFKKRGDEIGVVTAFSNTGVEYYFSSASR
jgi:hypothetical protein